MVRSSRGWHAAAGAAPYSVVGPHGRGDFHTAVASGGVGGRALFLALGASFFFLARASDMLVVSKNAMHANHGLRRGGVAFFKQVVQLLFGQWNLAYRVVFSVIQK